MDMLVRLYAASWQVGGDGREPSSGAFVRRAMAYERIQVVDWVRNRFGDGWSGECETSFSRTPVSCFIATREGSILGFACYDCTCRGFFGPVGVDEEWRGSGTGRALLHAGLGAMSAEGYAYAIIGGVDETSSSFYASNAAAVPIEGSDPGVYVDRLDRGSIDPDRGTAGGPASRSAKGRG